MVCDTIQQAETVFLDKDISKRRLNKAFKKLNFHHDSYSGDFTGTFGNEYIYGSFNDGYLTFPDGRKHTKFVKELKRQYAMIVLEEEAENMGWRIRDLGDSKYQAFKERSKDVIDFEILPDGTIKSSNGKISGINHASAEQFLLNIGRESGGKVTRTRRQISRESHSQKVAQ